MLVPVWLWMCVDVDVCDCGCVWLWMCVVGDVCGCACVWLVCVIMPWGLRQKRVLVTSNPTFDRLPSFLQLR